MSAADSPKAWDLRCLVRGATDYICAGALPTVPAKIPCGIEAAVTIRCHSRKGEKVVTTCRIQE